MSFVKLDALAEFASQQLPMALSSFEIAQRNGSFCLRPVHHSQAAQTLASLCIRAFDRYRAPLTPSELARRKAAMLSGQEKKNLEIWGYPYVFEQFRFHFALTAHITDRREKEAVHAALTETFGPLLASPLMLDALCLFAEPASGEPMRCLYRFPFPPFNPEPEECIAYDQLLLPQNFYPGYQCHSA